jgi:hypothetical protein
MLHDGVDRQNEWKTDRHGDGRQTRTARLVRRANRSRPTFWSKKNSKVRGKVITHGVTLTINVAFSPEGASKVRKTQLEIFSKHVG